MLLGAGRGLRLGGVPKAFVDLGGRTLLGHCVETVHSCPDIEAFLVAAPEHLERRAREIVGASPKCVGVVVGGETRQASVGAALNALPERFDAVVCHDVARPLAPPRRFSEVLAALAEADGAVPVLPMPDTVKRVVDGSVRETLSRDGLAVSQTPQAFRRGPLEAAHRRAEQDGFEGTDDAVLLERAGFRVAAVAGDAANLKVTEPADLRVAEALAATERHG